MITVTFDTATTGFERISRTSKQGRAWHRMLLKTKRKMQRQIQEEFMRAFIKNTGLGPAITFAARVKHAQERRRLAKKRH